MLYKMSKKNKNSLASALLEMEDIKKSIKEESKNTLKTMLSEAVKDALRESCNEEDDDEEYEVVDGEEENDAKTDSDGAEDNDSESSEGEVEEDGNELEDDPNAQPEVPAEGPEMGAEAGMEGEAPVDGAEEAPEAPAEGEGDDEWSEFQQYQSGDNTYDLTGVKDPQTVLKAYKLLNNDDQVAVKKNGNMINIQDNESGNEYIIDLGGDEGEAPEAEGEEMGSLNEGMFEGDDEFEYTDDDNFGMEATDDDSFNFEPEEEDYESEDWPMVSDGEESLDGDSPAGFDKFEGEPESELGQFDDVDNFNNRFEGKKSRKTMKENKAKKNEILFEIDLGYTDNYQSKDPIQGLSNSEPSKSGKSWEKGVPTGTEKPWAGETKSKGDPFKKTQTVQGSVNEEDIQDAPDSVEEPVDEQMNVGGFVQDNSTTTSRKPNNPTHRKARSERGTNYTPSTEAPYSSVNESLKKLKRENKALKEAVKALRTNLNEAYMTNVNLGKITKLFLENAVSQEEKVNIINRFSNEAKTIEQSNVLYESINTELKKVAKTNLTESTMTAEGSKKLNEDTIYKSKDLLDTLDFMKRMDRC